MKPGRINPPVLVLPGDPHDFIQSSEFTRPGLDQDQYRSLAGDHALECELSCCSGCLIIKAG